MLGFNVELQLGHAPDDRELDCCVNLSGKKNRDGKLKMENGRLQK
jgi:hypothetical protein